MTNRMAAAMQDVAAATVSPADVMHKLSASGLVKPLQYIGGEWRAAVSGQVYRVVSPWDGTEVHAEVAKGSREDACQAIEAAALSFPEWRETTAKSRATILRYGVREYRFSRLRGSWSNGRKPSCGIKSYPVESRRLSFICRFVNPLIVTAVELPIRLTPGNGTT